MPTEKSLSSGIHVQDNTADDDANSRLDEVDLVSRPSTASVFEQLEAHGLLNHSSTSLSAVGIAADPNSKPQKKAAFMEKEAKILGSSSSPAFASAPYATAGQKEAKTDMTQRLSTAVCREKDAKILGTAKSKKGNYKSDSPMTTTNDDGTTASRLEAATRPTIDEGDDSQSGLPNILQPYQAVDNDLELAQLEAAVQARTSLPGAFREAPATESTRLGLGVMAPMPLSRPPAAPMPPIVQETGGDGNANTTATGNSNNDNNNSNPTNDPVATPVDLETASPVGEEEDEEEQERRTSLKLQRRERSLKTIIGILFVLIAVLVPIAILLPLWAANRNKGDGENVAPATSGPAEEQSSADSAEEEDEEALDLTPLTHLESLLPEHTRAVIRQSAGAAGDSANPQLEAYNWLLADPQYPHYSDARLIQRYAMATLGYSMALQGQQDGWLNHGKHECDWETDIPPRNYIIKNVCNRRLEVHQLWFYDDPQGTLPPELGLLTSLLHMNIANTQLHGLVPSEIGLCQKLEILHLNSNDLFGPLPTELGLLTQMQDFRIPNNLFTGPLPSELSEMTRLRYFWGLSNSFSGAIPSELGLWPEILGMEVFDNSFSGSIPTELGLLTNLGELTIDGNSLTGPIPSELGDLSHLALFFLHNNDLTGTLPTDLGRLTTVFRFYIYTNQLTGSLPTELGLLTKMEIANLHDNQFTGSIPSEFGNWERLWALYMNFNQQTGVAPPEWGDAVQLRFDDTWDSNRFSGTLPSTLGLLTNLHYFWAPNGDLSGTIPTEFGNLAALSGMSFANNSRLEGTIPVGLSALREDEGGSLVHLDVSGTAIVVNGTA